MEANRKKKKKQRLSSSGGVNPQQEYNKAVAFGTEYHEKIILSRAIPTKASKPKQKSNVFLPVRVLAQSRSITRLLLLVQNITRK